MRSPSVMVLVDQISMVTSSETRVETSSTDALPWTTCHVIKFKEIRGVDRLRWQQQGGLVHAREGSGDRDR